MMLKTLAVLFFLAVCYALPDIHPKVLLENVKKLDVGLQGKDQTEELKADASSWSYYRNPYYREYYIPNSHSNYYPSYYSYWNSYW